MRTGVGIGVRGENDTSVGGQGELGFAARLKAVRLRLRSCLIGREHRYRQVQTQKETTTAGAGAGEKRAERGSDNLWLASVTPLGCPLFDTLSPPFFLIPTKNQVPSASKTMTTER
eukprot:1984468-Rhodomonas_salina.1